MKGRNGFLQLAGAAAALLILGLYAGLALMGSQALRSHQAVDSLVREMVIDMQGLRQHSMGNNIGSGHWKLILQKDRYVLHYRYREKKRRLYPPGLRVTKGVVQFDVYGRPIQKMVVTVSSNDSRYERRIVVAAQTGRIRIE